jgi:hypothetical protein
MNRGAGRADAIGRDVKIGYALLTVTPSNKDSFREPANLLWGFCSAF